MNWIIPGTTLEAHRNEADRTPQLFSSMFLAGGMVLSQVATVTGLEPYTIQNWVKRGFLSPPVAKRYNMEQVCRIINLNLLKGALPLEQTVSLMTYINGDLTSEEDDLIDDTVLYFKFVSLAARARHIGGTKEWGEALTEVMENYAEPYPGAKEKVKKVLQIMLTAWIVSQLREQTNQMISQL